MCFGTGSLVGVILCVLTFWRTSVREALTAAPEYNRPVWIRECAYFAVIGFLVSWTFRIGVLVLEVLPIEEAQVGFFAAAMETAAGTITFEIYPEAAPESSSQRPSTHTVPSPHKLRHGSAPASR